MTLDCTSSTPTIESGPLAGRSQWKMAWQSLRKNVTAMIGLAGLILLVVVTLLAPWLSPFDPTSMDVGHLMTRPDQVHLFGTDDLGRDVLSRVLWGGRESLRVAILAMAIAMSGGVIVGLISGFYDGLVDNIIQRLSEVFLAFPSILLLLTIVAVFGPSLSTVLLALGMSSIPSYGRLVRGSVLEAVARDYVLAARAVGVGNRGIMFRHILPNVIAPVIVYTTVGLGGAIMTTAGLSYVGLGAQPPSPEWGAMLNYGRGYLREAWWMSIFPGLAIFIAVLSVNLLGDGLRDAFDPKSRVV